MASRLDRLRNMVLLAPASLQHILTDWEGEGKKTALKIAEDAVPLPSAPKERRILKFSIPLDKISACRGKIEDERMERTLQTRRS